MSLALDTRYHILFTSAPNTFNVEVSVEDLAELPADNFVLELQTGQELRVQKCRLKGKDENSLALYSNGQYCLNQASGTVSVLITEAPDQTDESGMMITTLTITFPSVGPGPDWLIPDGAGNLQLTLYMTLINEGAPIEPCDAGQPETAIPDDQSGTVGGYPMVFVFPGTWEGGNKGGSGKKVRVIWKKDSLMPESAQ
ncbi:MAG: hypothetical protein WBQ23_04785 [Bacteroidota bacterium]